VGFFAAVLFALLLQAWLDGNACILVYRWRLAGWPLPSHCHGQAIVHVTFNSLSVSATLHGPLENLGFPQGLTGLFARFLFAQNIKAARSSILL